MTQKNRVISDRNMEVEIMGDILEIRINLARSIGMTRSEKIFCSPRPKVLFRLVVIARRRWFLQSIDRSRHRINRIAIEK